jgi:hypothetical protein
VRKSVADEAAKIVGKTEADKLKKYSEFMDAYGDIRSFTERKAGGEYLLRVVLSGRGREARQVIQTIKKHTGVDLMDDATMMMIATDVIGNSRQKNLFRQEITKAGLDVASLLRGDPSGAAALLADFVKNKALDEEKIFLQAARSQQAAPGVFAFGIAGLEQDEEGNITFSIERLLSPEGLATIGAVGSLTVAQNKTRVLKQSREQLVERMNKIKNNKTRGQYMKAIRKIDENLRELEK